MRAGSAFLAGAGSAAIVAAWLIPDHYLPWLSAYNDSAMALGLMLLLLGTVIAWYLITRKPITAIPGVVAVPSTSLAVR